MAFLAKSSRLSRLLCAVMISSPPAVRDRRGGPGRRTVAIFGAKL